MVSKLTQIIVLGLLLVLGGPAIILPGVVNPAVGIAHADDDDNGGDDNGGGGATLDPGLQWRLADTAWNKREYDDAAVLCIAYAEANPDEPNALEGWWRAYNVYRNNRPNPDKKKEMVSKLTAAASKWLTKYATSDKERAASALWYTAMLYDNEGQEDAAIATFDQLTKKFPGTSREADGWWYPAEWLHNDKRWSEAITHYEGYRRCVGITEWGSVSVFREADCYEQLKDKDDAIATYKIILDPKYNWGWWQLGWGALDAARRCITDGAPDLSRQIAMTITDKCPKDGGWGDLQNQAHALLGEAPAKKIWLYAYLYNHYHTSRIDISGSGKITVSHEPKLLVRVTYVTAADPFKGTLTITPKVDMKTVDPSMKKGDGDKPSYTADIQSPDAKGNPVGDLWYNWMQQDEDVDPPADLVLTRKWEKAGADWGNCTIRIQSSARWHMWIYLPNNKTNPTNVNIQPNEVNDGGKTFRYYDWYDLSQGMTITFPIEVGTQVTEYYPQIRLERNLGRFGDVSSAGTDAKDSLPEYDIDLSSSAAFPATFNHPVNEVLYMDEISK